MAPRANYLLGVCYAVTAALCFSTAGILMRWIALDAWEIVFWRCVFAGAALATFLMVRHRGRVIAAMRNTGLAGFLSGCAMAYMLTAICIAIDVTLVANVVACLAVSPFLTALFSWLLLREAITRATLIAMGVALAGILMIVAQSMGAQGLLGILLALSIAFVYAFYLIGIRRARAVDMLPATLYAVIIAGLVTLPFALPIEITWPVLPYLIVFGVVQLAGGLIFVTLASRHVPAAPLSLIMLIESIGSVIWTWLGANEAPVGLALAGVLAVLAAVLGNALIGVRASFARTRDGALTSPQPGGSSVGPSS